MKAYVYVSLKKTVLDPQGKTIQGALKKMGYQGLGDVRQGKFFEIALNGGLTKEQAHAEVEKMAREVLTNPVMKSSVSPSKLDRRRGTATSTPPRDTERHRSPPRAQHRRQ